MPVTEWTHTRPLPIAATLNVLIDSTKYTAQYVGHGKSKVAFELKAVTPHVPQGFSGGIMKICAEADLEPEIFTTLSSINVYPTTNEMESCFE